MNDFGWTEDPAILAVLKEHIWSADHEILTNRKDGGVHSAWLWPLGHFDDDPNMHTAQEDPNPIWTRVDLAWGRYFDDGCTFLIWEEYECRPGTLEDAVLFVKGLNTETPRTQAREDNRQWVEFLNELQKTAQATSLPSWQIAALHKRAEHYKGHVYRWPVVQTWLEKITSLSSFNQHADWMRSRGNS